ASLPPTRPLEWVLPDMLVRRPSEDLSVEPEEDFTEAAPPRPHFALPDRHTSLDLDTLKRPRIVVPINLEAQRQMELRARQEIRAEKGFRRPAKRELPVGSVLPASRKRRALVALGLILAFSGMLLATHKYVTTRWNPLTGIPQAVEPVII